VSAVEHRLALVSGGRFVHARAFATEAERNAYALGVRDAEEHHHYEGVYTFLPGELGDRSDTGLSDETCDAIERALAAKGEG